MLARDGRDESVLSDPDLADSADSAYRRALLEEHRAYERREGLFLGFPRKIDWFRAAFGRDELLDVLFIDWVWWLTLSGGSRRPRDAAQRIRDGKVAGVTAEEHEPLAAAFETAAWRPEPIAVTCPARAPVVLVGGIFRLTAWALFPEYVPVEVEILLGISDEVASWSEW